MFFYNVYSTFWKQPSEPEVEMGTIWTVVFFACIDCSIRVNYVVAKIKKVEEKIFYWWYGLDTTMDYPHISEWLTTYLKRLQLVIILKRGSIKCLNVWWLIQVIIFKRGSIKFLNVCWLFSYHFHKGVHLNLNNLL